VFSLFCFLAGQSYLNGKLDDNTKYAVFQRSFADKNNYENEGFITFKTEKDQTGTIVAAVIVPIVLVAVIAAAVFVYRRRQNRDNNEDEEMPMNARPHRRRTGSKLFRRSGIGKSFRGFFFEFCGSTCYPELQTQTQFRSKYMISRTLFCC